LHLEVQIAGLAAERRSKADLEQIEEILRETLAARGLDEFVRTDMAFHSALAQATHNELYSLLLDSIAEVMRAVRVMAFHLYEPEANPKRSYKYHRAIYEQVKQSSAEGARQAMRDHLAEAEETIMRVMAMRALQSGDGH
ncbi:MAG: FCD domain-containing protein, partial [Acidobacteriales bacterium]|nr:FCD domain-containing protein [Terriglobales bacterium]